MKYIHEFRKPLYVSLLFGLAGCASPHVVDEYQIGDAKLSCPALEEHMRKTDSFQDAALEEKGVTGKNAVALALFWPALISTQLNAGEAVKAAKERKRHLYGIYMHKGCEGYVSSKKTATEADSMAGMQDIVTDSRLTELDQMRAQGLVTKEDYIVIKRKLLGL